MGKNRSLEQAPPISAPLTLILSNIPEVTQDTAKSVSPGSSRNTPPKKGEV